MKQALSRKNRIIKEINKLVKSKAESGRLVVAWDGARRWAIGNRFGLRQTPAPHWGLSFTGGAGCCSELCRTLRRRGMP